MTEQTKFKKRRDKVKKLIIGIVLSVMLIAVMAAPAIADEVGEVGKTATVTVLGYKSVTITGSTGLNWDNLNPGVSDVAELGSPSITISAAAENNGSVLVEIKGTDFSNTGATESFAVSNAKWDTDSNVAGATLMNTNYATVTSLAAGTSVDIYHWLSIPAGQAADSYESTFIYKTS
jgi:hypothetical protein